MAKPRAARPIPAPPTAESTPPSERRGVDIEINGVPIVVWAARLSLYFLVQGAIILASYAYYGFDTDPNSFALGFRLDPIHAGVHLVWGLVGTFIGFYLPRYSTAFVLAFAAFYTVMALLGSFTHYHLGMKLDTRVNLFHWSLLLPAWAIGLHALWQQRIQA